MKVPSPLAPGCRVALVAPSGPVKDPQRLEAAVAAVEQQGLVPVVYPSCRARYGYLAGSDRQRAADLEAAFGDPAIQGVICIRGGYGAMRMLPLLDLGVIRQNPKPFFGYSDITALHTVFNQQCGFVTYHTPMPGTEWHGGLDDYSAHWLGRALFGGPWGAVQNPEGVPLTRVRGGRATGRLAGGNLSLVAAGVGTPYQAHTDGVILFLEDIHEQPYRIDSMLTQLRNAGLLRRCAGILLGYWTDCDPPPDTPEGHSLSHSQVFEDLLGDLGIPVVAGLCCGHQGPSLSLPMGATATLDGDRLTLEIAP